MGETPRHIKMRICIKDVISFIYTLQKPGTLYLDLNCKSALSDCDPQLQRVKYLYNLEKKLQKKFHIWKNLLQKWKTEN